VRKLENVQLAVLAITRALDRLHAPNAELELTPNLEPAVAVCVSEELTVGLVLEFALCAMVVRSAEQERVFVDNARLASTARPTWFNASRAILARLAEKAQRLVRRHAKQGRSLELGQRFAKVAYPVRGLHQALQCAAFVKPVHGARRGATNASSAELENTLAPLLHFASTAMRRWEKWRATRGKAPARFAAPAVRLMTRFMLA